MFLKRQQNCSGRINLISFKAHYLHFYLIPFRSHLRMCYSLLSIDKEFFHILSFLSQSRGAVSVVPNYHKSGTRVPIMVWGKMLPAIKRFHTYFVVIYCHKHLIFLSFTTSKYYQVRTHLRTNGRLDGLTDARLITINSKP